jgi:hypothetical protein
VVARFLADLGANNHTIGRPHPPAPRSGDDHDALANGCAPTAPSPDHPVRGLP